MVCLICLFHITCFTDAENFEPKGLTVTSGANKWEGEDEEEDVKVRILLKKWFRNITKTEHDIYSSSSAVSLVNFIGFMLYTCEDNIKIHEQLSRLYVNV